MSLQLSGIGPLLGLPTVVSASVVVPPREDGLTISGGGGGLRWTSCSGAWSCPLEDSGTDLEDELVTPDGSLSTDAAKPEVGPAPWGVDVQLARALLEVGVLPSMVTPIIDPVVETSRTRRCTQCLSFWCCRWPTRSLCRWPLPFGRWVGAQFWISPCRTWCRLLAPCPSRSRPGSRLHYEQMMFPDCRPAWPRWTSTCRGMLHCCLGESTDAPFLPAPLTPRQIIEKLVPGSVECSPTGEPVAAASLSMPDLSREGPFDVHQDSSKSGASPRVLDSLRGCQYRMTSYYEYVGAAARVCGCA